MKSTKKNVNSSGETVDLYSGMTLNDAVSIHRTGYRDGIGYGPDGHQLGRGIFTTLESADAKNWGAVKLNNRLSQKYVEFPDDLGDFQSVGLLRFLVRADSNSLDLNI